MNARDRVQLYPMLALGVTVLGALWYTLAHVPHYGISGHGINGVDAATGAQVPTIEECFEIRRQYYAELDIIKHLEELRPKIDPGQLPEYESMLDKHRNSLMELYQKFNQCVNHHPGFPR